MSDVRQASGGRYRILPFHTFGSMKIRKIPTGRLREILTDTERAAGCESTSAKILRRELERRQHGRQQETLLTPDSLKEVSRAD